jgi:hypothetical protein
MQPVGTACPGSPPLNNSLYGSCFAVQLEGYLNVERNNELQWDTPHHDDTFYNKYRVCIQYNNHAQVGASAT